MPLVHYYDASLTTPYMVTDKCELLIDAFGILPFEAKISNIHSYARIALDLFRIDAPNGIGSVSSFKSTADAQSGEPILVYRGVFQVAYPCQKDFGCGGNYETRLDEAQGTLKQLENLILESVSGYDTAFLEAYHHMKISPDKTFLLTAKASSQVPSTGSFTWSSRLYWLQPIHLGFAMMEPLTLGLLIGRVSFPRFRWLVRWMQKGLRQEYDAIVKEEDPEYYRALKTGEFCRMAEEWLLNDRMGIGCRRMKAWLDNPFE